MQNTNIINAFRAALPNGTIAQRGDDPDELDFTIEIGASTLQGWAFFMGQEDVVVQIYCNIFAENKYIPSINSLIDELNRKIPIGNYQSTDDVLITYRSHFFAKDDEMALFGVRQVIDWAQGYLELHLPALLAVAGGFSTAAGAIALIEARSIEAPPTEESDA